MRIALSSRLRSLERTMIRRIFDSAPPDAINLGLGQPDLPTPHVAALGGVAGIAAGRTGYAPTAGLPELRELLAERYRAMARGPENVLVTVGSQEAMTLACMALAEAGDEILYPDPGYPAYPVVAGLLGARAVPYALPRDRGFRLDAARIAERIGPRTRAVILCAPSNPTGACIAPEELRTLTGLLAERGIPWISDEIYAGFCYDERFTSPTESNPAGGFVVSSLSKDLAMTGWRVGWVIGPGEAIERMTAAHQYLVTCTPTISQTAAVAALGDAGRAAAAAYLERFRSRRQVMLEALREIPGLSVEPPDGAFYFFVDVSRFGDSVEIARSLSDRRGVIVIPGEAFGENGRGFLRISFAASAARIREGVSRIAEELAARTP